jgi:KaiB domain.
MIERAQPAVMPRASRHVLLFVAGSEANSIAALENFQRLREAVRERCDLKLRIVDVLDDYRAALEHKVFVTPCLVLVEPAPKVMLVGTLRDTAKVRAALRLPPLVHGDA